MDADEIADLFAAFAEVKVRRMFGGSGLYAEGLMFAIEVDGIIYLKADPAFAAALEPRGSSPFSYEAQGAVRTMRGFWSVPEAALDDADELATLARHALMLAQVAAEAHPAKRSPAKQSPAKRSPTKPRAPRRGPAVSPAQTGDGPEIAEPAPASARARPARRSHPAKAD